MMIVMIPCLVSICEVYVNKLKSLINCVLSTSNSPDWCNDLVILANFGLCYRVTGDKVVSPLMAKGACVLELGNMMVKPQPTHVGSFLCSKQLCYVYMCWHAIFANQK